MANKKKTKEPVIEEKIFQQDIVDTLELNYMPYAMSVIVSRAIPEIDGFKPSHRKLLYTMYKMGLMNGDRTKSSNVVGQTMKLNPHGDSAIYETLVRLTEGNASLLHPFVDSKGNFGKQYSRDMAYAAPRYTEVKLASICAEIFADIDKNTVEFIDNYDGTIKEPVLLPTTFPNVLVNPNQGIAVGMASSICSFNLKEVCDTAIALLKNEDADITKTLLAPDFPTGGQLIFSKKEMKQIYDTGRGSFRVRAKYRFDEENNCIEITEIPYSTNVESIIDKTISLIKSGKIREITDIRDETDLNGLKIAIDIRKNTKPEMLMHKLYSQTPLSDSFSCNFNILIDGNPKTLGVRDILKEWIRFRMTNIRNQVQFDILKKSEKLHLLEGLAKILLDIDQAIAIIRNTSLDADVIPNLIKGFSIDEKQAEYIAEIKLRNINKEYILNRTKELSSLRDEIADLKDILSNEKRIRDIIINQLKNVSKKYGKPRLTEIITKDDLPIITGEDLIEDYGVHLFLTEEGYFKKISLVSMRSASDQKLKENDHIIYDCESTNKAELLFFSNKQNVYKLKVNDIPDCKASSLGEYLANLLSLEENESILYFTATYDYSGYMIFVFQNGKATKVLLSSYATKVNRRKLINAYSAKEQLVFMTSILDNTDLLFLRDQDKAALINTDLLNTSVSKNAAGVQVVKLKKNSFLTHVYLSKDFISEDIEFYRSDKIPTTGHFLREKDKESNHFLTQMKLT